MVVDASPLLRVLMHRVEPRVDRQTVDNAARPRLAVDRSLAVLVAKLVLEDLDVGDATRLWDDGKGRGRLVDIREVPARRCTSKAVSLAEKTRGGILGVREGGEEVRHAVRHACGAGLEGAARARDAVRVPAHERRARGEAAVLARRLGLPAAIVELCSQTQPPSSGRWLTCRSRSAHR